MRILIATGGTGGHIYPALALADILMEKEPATKILFVGTANRMEAVEIPAAHYDFAAIKAKGMNGSVFAKLSASAQLFFAYRQSLKIVKEFRPDAVIGFGNYISVPVIMAAHKLKVPTMIHEQNSYAGKANRMLGKYADMIVGCYNENLDQFPKEKTKILGNPRAQLAASAQHSRQDLRRYGLDTEKPCVVIVMGSLGSTSINDMMLGALKRMDKKPYQILYVTGKQNYDSFVSQFPATDNIKVVPYMDGMKVMPNVDLAVVRGGATTAAEITALGVPSVIIPSPYVPNNHQVMNALALKNVEAAEMIEEKDLTEERIVAKIESVIFNDSLRRKMKENAVKIGFPHAADEMIDWLKEKCR